MPALVHPDRLVLKYSRIHFSEDLGNQIFIPKLCYILVTKNILRVRYKTYPKYMAGNRVLSGISLYIWHRVISRIFYCIICWLVVTETHTGCVIRRPLLSGERLESWSLGLGMYLSTFNNYLYTYGII